MNSRPTRPLFSACPIHRRRLPWLPWSVGAGSGPMPAPSPSSQTDTLVPNSRDPAPHRAATQPAARLSHPRSPHLAGRAREPGLHPLPRQPPHQPVRATRAVHGPTTRLHGRRHRPRLERSKVHGALRPELAQAAESIGINKEWARSTRLRNIVLLHVSLDDIQFLLNLLRKVRRH